MSQATEEQRGFEIEGRVYPAPGLDALSFEEAQVLYDYSGLTVEDFIPPDEEAEDYTPAMTEEYEEGLARKTKNPGFLRAMLHIAYSRGNPTAKRVHIERVVANANFVKAVVDFVGSEEDDPKATSQNEPDSPRSTSSESSPELSSTDSTKSSDEPADDLSPTGDTRSDTSPEPSLAISGTTP